MVQTGENHIKIMKLLDDVNDKNNHLKQDSTQLRMQK